MNCNNCYWLETQGLHGDKGACAHYLKWVNKNDKACKGFWDKKEAERMLKRAKV